MPAWLKSSLTAAAVVIALAVLIGIFIVLVKQKPDTDNVAKNLGQLFIPKGEYIAAGEDIDGENQFLVVSSKIIKPSAGTTPPQGTSNLAGFNAARMDAAKRFLGPEWVEFFPKTNLRLEAIEERVGTLETSVKDIGKKVDEALEELKKIPK